MQPLNSTRHHETRYPIYLHYPIVLSKLDNPMVRLVLVSGSIDPQSLEVHLQLGFDSVLPKPFNFRQLREIITSHN